MSKMIAIMQPYFLPYIGYWQLLNLVDEFVIYDNIQYSKKGWINRNRYLCGDHDKYFTLELEKASDYLDVCERYISESFNKHKLLNQVREAYRNAPYFLQTYELLNTIMQFNTRNLFEFILNSIKKISENLEIKTKITISSHVSIDHSLKSEQKVLAICKALGADRYVNPIGGIELYNKHEFSACGIELLFLKSANMPYKQMGGEFISFLSILDVLMFIGIEETRAMLESYNMESS